jgi:hypothetical protein
VAGLLFFFFFLLDDFLAGSIFYDLFRGMYKESG